LVKIRKGNIWKIDFIEYGFRMDVVRFGIYFLRLLVYTAKCRSQQQTSPSLPFEKKGKSLNFWILSLLFLKMILRAKRSNLRIHDKNFVSLLI